MADPQKGAVSEKSYHIPDLPYDPPDPMGLYDRFSARTVDDYRIRIEEKILPAIEADDWNAA